MEEVRKVRGSRDRDAEMECQKGELVTTPENRAKEKKSPSGMKNFFFFFL